MSKAAMGHVRPGLASTQNEVIILDKQQKVLRSIRVLGCKDVCGPRLVRAI